MHFRRCWLSSSYLRPTPRRKCSSPPSTSPSGFSIASGSYTKSLLIETNQFIILSLHRLWHNMTCKKRITKSSISKISIFQMHFILVLHQQNSNVYKSLKYFNFCNAITKIKIQNFMYYFIDIWSKTYIIPNISFWFCNTAFLFRRVLMDEEKQRRPPDSCPIIFDSWYGEFHLKTYPMQCSQICFAPKFK